MMVTATLFKVIQSELQKMGNTEIMTPNNEKYFDPPFDFDWIDDDKQFTTKILKYDDDVSIIVDNLFSGVTLENPEYDRHFKKGFIYRFVNRQINKQTIEAFKMDVLATFLANETYINTIYNDLDLFVSGTSKSKQENRQTNTQQTDGTSTTDNRQAYADLPQSATNLDVNNTKMEYPSDNTISRNRQQNNQNTDGQTEGETKSESQNYQLDMLIKSNGLLENVYNIFDKKCFLQIW